MSERTLLTSADYRNIIRLAPRARASDVTGAAVHMVAIASIATQSAGGGQSPLGFYLDPAVTPKLRIAYASSVNDTAPGVSFTLGLYPFGIPSGGSAVYNPNYGTVVTGSTKLYTTPLANSKSAETVLPDIDCPSAGWYGFGTDISGAMAAGSMVLFAIRFEYRNVA